MAEFCLKCWNELNKTQLTERDVIISKDYDLCEGCGEIKAVIIRYKSDYIFKEALKSRFRE